MTIKINSVRVKSKLYWRKVLGSSHSRVDGGALIQLTNLIKSMVAKADNMLISVSKTASAYCLMPYFRFILYLHPRTISVCRCASTSLLSLAVQLVCLSM